MKVETALVTCNLNPTLIDFFPVILKGWNDLIGIECKLVLIADEIPPSLKCLERDIILYSHPDPGISTIFISQCIRLLYPGLISTSNGGVVISDVDMLPLKREYFTTAVASVTDDKFVVYRNVLEQIQQYPMCYNAALPTVWQTIFKCSSKQDIDATLSTWFLECTDNGKVPYDPTRKISHWNFDQRKLFQTIHNLPNLFVLDQIGSDARNFRRFDATTLNLPDCAGLIRSNVFNDLHFIRCVDCQNDRSRNTCHTLINSTFLDMIFLPASAPVDKQVKDMEYGTHIVPLATAVANTSGPILEMGAGEFSTPLLHALCAPTRRALITADTSKEWLQNFRSLQRSYHEFQYVPVYEDDWCKNSKPQLWDMFSNDTTKKWGVVFVDHRPGERRVVDINRFQNNAEIIVVHDTEAPIYGYDVVFKTFKYRYDYKRYRPYTSLVSNFVDVTLLFFE